MKCIENIMNAIHNNNPHQGDQYLILKMHSESNLHSILYNVFDNFSGKL